MMSLTRGHLKAGLDSVGGAKLRNFWTMLGVIIGVASVITVVAIGEGVKHQVSNQIHHSGSIITVQPSAPAVSNGTSSLNLLSGLSLTGSLNPSDVNTVASTPGVSSAVPLSAMTAKITGNQSTYKNGLVIGTTQDMASDFNQSMQYGVFLIDSDSSSYGVVLGSQAALDLFNEDVPLGQSLMVNGRSFTVRGVFNSFPVTPLSTTADFNNAIFIPYDITQQMTNNTAETYQILANPTNVHDDAKVARAISSHLRSAHGGQSDFSVYTAQQTANNNSAILDLLTRLIAGTAAISLLVGGIGIMNVMLVSVTERMHEIGIRKAVGATNRQIWSQFTIEAAVLSLVGGIIGIIIAGITDLALRLATDLEPEINWQIVVLATVVALLVGIIFGTIPALKAARKDPIEALRGD